METKVDMKKYPGSCWNCVFCHDMNEDFEYTKPWYRCDYLDSNIMYSPVPGRRENSIEEGEKVLSDCPFKGKSAREKEVLILDYFLS